MSSNVCFIGSDANPATFIVKGSTVIQDVNITGVMNYRGLVSASWQSSNALAYYPDDVLVGSNISNASYRTVGSNFYPPIADGRINDVNITVLNQRVRPSNAIVNKSVNTWSGQAINFMTYNNLRNYFPKCTCWSPELGLFCTVGFGQNNVQVGYSSDGIHWTPTGYNLDVNLNMYTVCWVPELKKFYAMGGLYSSNPPPGHVVISTDGQNWNLSLVPTLDGTEWYAMCWSPELRLFCVVGYNYNTNNGCITTSSDGMNWTQIQNAPQWPGSVCWSPELGLFCIVGGTFNQGTAFAMTSPDGINWTTTSLPQNMRPQDICWSPELSIFCIATDGNQNEFITSKDGVNWNVIVPNIPSSWYGICWSSELCLFCAVGTTMIDHNCATSPDGQTWTSHVTPDNRVNYWQSVCWSPELSIFCSTPHRWANSGIFSMTSTPALPTAYNTITTLHPSGLTVDRYGNVGIGKTTPIAKLQVVGNSILGDNTGSSTSAVSSIMYNNGAFDAATSTHTISPFMGASADTFAGFLMIFTKNTNTSTAKSGCMLISFTKTSGSQIANVTTIHTNQSANLTTFTAAATSNSITVTTDSDCQVTWQLYTGM